MDVALHPISGQTFPPDQQLYDSQIALFDWTMTYPDPQDLLSLLFLPDDGYSLGHADVPQTFALLRQADAQNPSRYRLSLYQQAEGDLRYQVAACPLLQGALHYIVSPSVHIWSIAATGIPANDTWRAAYIAAS